MIQENAASVITTSDRLQKQRFELKYVINESKAQSIRFFCRNYLTLDAFGSTQPDNSYPVNSIYLDSPGYKTYQDTINGNRNRYKLRIRYYEKTGDQPVFLEIKRRYNFIIAKKRAEVKRASAEPIVMGQIPSMNDLVQPGSSQFQSLTDFSTLLNQLQARPTAHVTYMREAWERHDSNAVRITFDRNVRTERGDRTAVRFNMRPQLPVFGNQVVLELKFTDRFPLWMQELVQRFGLRQRSAAKYVDGLIRMKEQKIYTG